VNLGLKPEKKSEGDKMAKKIRGGCYANRDILALGHVHLEKFKEKY